MGLIRSEDNIKKTIDFSGLFDDKEEKRTGSDIDFYWEDGEKVIYVEVKTQGYHILKGQRIALERFVDNNTLFKKSIAVVVWDKQNNPTKADLKDCIVQYYYYNGKWQIDKEHHVFKKFFRNYIGKPLAEDKEN